MVKKVGRFVPPSQSSIPKGLRKFVDVVND